MIGDCVYESTIAGAEKSFQTNLSPGAYTMVISDQKNQLQNRLIIQ